MNDDEWLSVNEAVKRVPSPRAGKKTHTSTVIRWILSGRLPAQKRGRYYFVRPQDLAAMMQPAQVVRVPRLNAERELVPQTSAWAKKILDDAGI